MGQHAAETPQNDGHGRDALLRQVALDIAGDEILPPLQRGFRVGGEVASEFASPAQAV
jgi:hypothetical protein